jgi:periplasmic divalent cation tolerance protein
VSALEPVKGEFRSEFRSRIPLAGSGLRHFACDAAGGANLDAMLLAWTTVSERAHADRLAASCVAQNLAVCVQIDGPITSHYRWQGQDERAEEFRLCFKLLESHAAALEQHVLTNHPYDTPEWVVVRAEHVGEKYLSWARANSSTPPL